MDSSVASFSVFSYFSSPPMQQHLVHSALGFQECGRGFLTSMLNEMEQARMIPDMMLSANQQFKQDIESLTSQLMLTVLHCSFRTVMSIPYTNEASEVCSKVTSGNLGPDLCRCKSLEWNLCVQMWFKTGG